MPKYRRVGVDPDVAIPAPMENYSIQQALPEYMPKKLYRINLNVTCVGGDEAYARVVKEVTAYDITNITQGNYVLKEVGKEGKGRKNLPKIKVTDGFDLNVHKSIAVRDGGIHVETEVWVFGNVDTYTGLVRNQITETLMALCGHATACMLALVDEQP